MEKKEIVEMEKYVKLAVERPTTIGGKIGGKVIENIENLSSNLVFKDEGTLGVGILIGESFKAEMTYKMLRAMFEDAVPVDDDVARARENAGTAVVI